MKNILVISPQHWNHIAVSKHHYAMELASDKNMQVFFLCPPSRYKEALFSIENSEFSENLFVIEYSYPLPLSLFFRYKLTFIYDLAMKLWVRKILLSRIENFEEVWCFDGNVFRDLRWFRSKKVFFFQVDSFDVVRTKRIGKSATAIITISEMLMEPFNDIESRKFIINHGLARHFQYIAGQKLEKLLYEKELYKEETNACFFGNLKVPQIDHDVFKTIIRENPAVTFHFWGTYNIVKGEVVTPKSRDFIEFIKVQSNVKLYGPVSSQELSHHLKHVDCFIFCYNLNFQNKGNNAHKIIEALSTGKVIISNYYPILASIPNLAVIPDDYDNQGLPILFKQAISNLELLNNYQSMKLRIEYSLKNTYEENIQKLRIGLNVEKSLTPIRLDL